MTTLAHPAHRPLPAGLYATLDGRPLARLTYRRSGVELVVDSIHAFTPHPRRDVVDALVRSASRLAEAEGRVLVGASPAALTTGPPLHHRG